jgi:hypothetical protein
MQLQQLKNEEWAAHVQGGRLQGGGDSEMLLPPGVK